MKLLSRLEKGNHRMLGALHRFLELMPGYASVALGLDYQDSEDCEIAATDGKRVFAGPGFENLRQPEKRFVLAHEFLHVILGHVPRLRLLEKREGCRFDRRLANLVQDALINTSLIASHREKSGKWNILEVPDWTIRLRDVLREIGDLPENDQSDADLEMCGRYTFEELYYRVKREGRPADWGGKFEGDILAPAGGTETTEKALQGEIAIARDQFSGVKGHAKGAINRLVKEFPQVEVPWDEVLVGWMTSYARGKRLPDYGRPSRRYSALEGEFSKNGVNLPFEPGRSFRKSGRIAIAVDTSGSISDEILESFFGHMAAIIDQWDPLVLIVVADQQVHEVYEFKGKEAVAQLRELVFTGGGGTDFRPAIQFAGSWNPDVLVYLTDLCGNVGDEPGFPVLWAVVPGYETYFKWGELVVLK
jgi:predicted metal-dependent peptidase